MVDEKTLMDNLDMKRPYSWVIDFKGAKCKFESDSHSYAVIYDLEVPKSQRNNGIGTSLVKVAEKVIRENTEANILYAQVGASNGATKHVLQSKRGFNVVDVRHQDSLGKIVDAEKRI